MTRRLTVLFIAPLLVALVACGDDGGADRATSSPATTVTPSTGGADPAPSDPAEAANIAVYLGRDGSVAAAGRRVDPPAVARGAIEALLEGATAQETELGITSAIPDGTMLIDLSLAGGLATVDLSGAFLADLGDDTALRVAQVVFTLTQFPTVDRVTIRPEGVEAESVGFDAVPVLEVDRSDFEAVTPFVLAESPTPGAAVAAPVEVIGIANTFEANVRYEVTGSGGEVLDDGFTTATAGSGTWGDFSFTTDLPSGEALISVFQESAEDGSRDDVYEVPVSVT